MATPASEPDRTGFPWTEWNYDKNAGLIPSASPLNRRVWWKCERGHEWVAVPADRVARMSSCPFCINKRVWIGFNDLQTVNPKLAGEWHPTRNGSLTPSDVVFGSGKDFWWRCANGHEWKAQLHSRITKGRGCRFCLGQLPIQGKTDLASTQPALAAEWNFEKNSLQPTDVMQNTPKKVWWTCSRGHDFEAWINNRTRGNGCPYCSGRKLLKGFNDLQTLRPQLASEWHPTKNEKDASEVRASDGTRWWWLCSEGHEFQSDRRYGLGGCPYCSSRKLDSGTNDLATTHPDLLSWWDYSRNDKLPSGVISSSSDRFHWVCPEKKHPFTQSIYERRVGAGCPVCVGKHVVAGVNDLATVNPFLASQWNFDRNMVDPKTVTANSHKRVWWRCSLGHSWEASVKNRNNGTGCPFCGNDRLLQGFNDLASVAPLLSREWDIDANQGKRPEEICVGDDSTWMWRCSEGHTWRTKIRARLAGSGCRVCAGQAVDPGKTDLASTHPHLAAEWHPSKNSPLTPMDVMAGTGTKIWWQCLLGHEWKTSGNSRLAGTGCPACSRPGGYDPTKPGVLYFIRNEGLRSNKVGITGVTQSRLQQFQIEGWAVVQTWESDGSTIADAETAFFFWLRKELGIPSYLGPEEMKNTGGFSETFDADSLSDFEIISKIRKIMESI